MKIYTLLCDALWLKFFGLGFYELFIIIVIVLFDCSFMNLKRWLPTQYYSGLKYYYRFLYVFS